MKNKNKKTINEATSHAEAFSYSGAVDIKVMDGERCLAKINSHNTGRKNLFKFLTSCLTGNFNAAKDLRPCKLVMFSEVTLTGGRTEGIENISPYTWNDECRVSTRVMYDTAPTITTTDTESTITYHFRVPFLCLTGGAQVKKLGLYPTNFTGYSDTLCAAYILTEPIQIPTNGGNYTIIVDWKLTIKNNDI